VKTHAQLFIDLADAEGKIADLQSELDFYKSFVKASEIDQAEDFMREVHYLATEARRGAAARPKNTGEICDHSDVIIWASVGMAQCKICGTNLDRSFFEDKDKDVLAIAELVGVSLPREPLPLIPGLMPPKHHFQD
jgi:hypothetical protein